MSPSMPVVWTERHRLHEPAEIWVGVRTVGTEVPERAERIREALADAGAPIVEPEDHPRDDILTVHDAALVEHLSTAWDQWEAAGLTEDPGQDHVVPYLFPHPDLISDRTLDPPYELTARAGYFAYDTMTLIGPGTWDAIKAAVDAALTAAELVLAGTPAAYACCRPPGHHATRRSFGGSCYLNNSALAAARLRASLGDPVAIIDLDAHHGNGAQAIFYEDPGVLTGSVHANPGAGWFPHMLGFADETGAGEGEGANRNHPLDPGTGDATWLAAVEDLAAWTKERGARALVIPLGVDAGAGDTEAPLEVSADGYRAAGRTLGALRLPTVIVQEGGYDLDTIGELVRETLLGFEEGAARSAE
jgi:acetoin utilization deacetylase AcuC-like enzyme